MLSHITISCTISGIVSPRYFPCGIDHSDSDKEQLNIPTREFAPSLPLADTGLRGPLTSLSSTVKFPRQGRNHRQKSSLMRWIVS